MNNRRWLWLLLSVSFTAVPPMASAQIMPSIDVPGREPASSKQSHHDLPGVFDVNDVQEMMAQRLRELRELHQLQDQVQELLKDPEFIGNLQQQFRGEKWQQLQEKLLKGGGLSRDGNLNQLLQQAASSQKLDQRQIIDVLRRWAERGESKPPSEPEASATAKSPSLTLPALTAPPSSAPTPSLPPEVAPQSSSLFDRMQEETSQWLMDHLDEVGSEAFEALVKLGGNDEGAPVNEWLRAMKQSDLSGGNFAEQAAELSDYLPKLSDFLPERRGIWKGVASLFDEAQPPSLPSFGDSSATLADAGGWMPVMLSVLMLGVLVLFLCKMIRKSPAASEESETWRLGAWPVSPSGVSTRQDVIRAFEYLALLCLGPAAGTCHHRELAERLAEQDNGNSSRRQAADMLAWLYEQARYAPADESLSEGALSAARHALCLLAGVTAP